MAAEVSELGCQFMATSSQGPGFPLPVHSFTFCNPIINHAIQVMAKKGFGFEQLQKGAKCPLPVFLEIAFRGINWIHSLKKTQERDLIITLIFNKDTCHTKMCNYYHICCRKRLKQVLLNGSALQAENAFMNYRLATVKIKATHCIHRAAALNFALHVTSVATLYWLDSNQHTQGRYLCGLTLTSRSLLHKQQKT